MGVPGLIPVLMEAFRKYGTDPQVKWRLDTFYEDLMNLTDGQPITNLCFDLPGIIHHQAAMLMAYGDYSQLNSSANPGPDSAIKIAEGTFSTICDLTALYKPTKIVVAMDGPIASAKMKQQRDRRFKAVSTVIQARPFRQASSPMTFDTNNITAGTPFMRNFESRLLELFRLEAKSDSPRIPELHFYSQKGFGEGEHKLMGYLRENAQPDDWQVIIGQDTDLLMLALTLETNVVLSRESFYTHISIPLVREALRKGDIDPIDFVAGISLIGNDFLPHHDLNTDREFSVHFILKILEYLGEHALVEDGLINWTSMIYLIWLLSELEREHISTYARRVIDVQNSSFTYNEVRRIEDNWYIREIYHGRRPRGETLKLVKSIVAETRDDMCKQYLTGLAWIFQYYLYGIERINNNWQYPYTYPPLYSSIIEYTSTHEIDYHEYELYVARPGPFWRSNVHLITVLPVSSWSECLPKPALKKFNESVLPPHLAYFPSRITSSTLDLIPKETTERTFRDYHRYVPKKVVKLPREFERVYAPWLSPEVVSEVLRIGLPKFQLKRSYILINITNIGTYRHNLDRRYATISRALLLDKPIITVKPAPPPVVKTIEKPKSDSMTKNKPRGGVNSTRSKPNRGSSNNRSSRGQKSRGDYGSRGRGNRSSRQVILEEPP
jgi:5'-3' exonuclease